MKRAAIAAALAVLMACLCWGQGFSRLDGIPWQTYINNVPQGDFHPSEIKLSGLPYDPPGQAAFASNRVGFKGPELAITEDVIWELPPADAAGCWQSDGAGKLSIGACGGSGAPFPSGTSIMDHEGGGGHHIYTVHGGSPDFWKRRANGTIAAPADAVAGDILGSTAYFGWLNGEWKQAGAFSHVAGQTGAGYVSGSFVFETVQDAATVTTPLAIIPDAISVIGHVKTGSAGNFDIGEPEFRWRSVYADAASITDISGNGAVSYVGTVTGGNLVAAAGAVTMQTGLNRQNSTYTLVNSTDIARFSELTIGSTWAGRATVIDSARNATVNDLTVTGTCFGCGGSSLPAPDTTSIVMGSADPSKQLRFEVDGFSSGAVRVLTPPNANAVIAGTNLANTWAAVQTFATHINPQGSGVSDIGGGGATWNDLRMDGNLYMDGFITISTSRRFEGSGGVDTSGIIQTYSTYNMDGFQVINSSRAFVGSGGVATAGSIVANGGFGHVDPSANNIWHLGTSSRVWNKLWVTDIDFNGTMTAPNGVPGVTLGGSCPSGQAITSLIVSGGIVTSANCGTP